MPSKLNIADLAAGQTVTFRTKHRTWRDYKVVTADHLSSLLTVQDSFGGPPQRIPLADVLPATLERLA